MPRLQYFVIPAKAGNPVRRFRKKNIGESYAHRLWIPAFAGMTRYYRMAIVFHSAISSAFQMS